MSKKSTLNNRKSLLIIVSLACILAFILILKFSSGLLRSNRQNIHEDYFDLYIPTGTEYSDVYKILRENNVLIDSASFRWLASKKKYANIVHPGRYRLGKGMSNADILDKLKFGRQDPVRVVFNNIRFVEDFAGKIGKQIEADSFEILSLLKNQQFADSMGFDLETIRCMFIPNTYEFYWNTSAEKFMEKMKKEYDRFWNKKRLERLDSIGLTKTEVSILASIVEEESLKDSENPVIAGVYINRINRGMPLQADPTVRYAVGDFNIKRILKKHLEIESPYNTYKHAGLPPGPIRFPSINAIDAVLNYDHNDYLYFCAKADFSGYHNFSKTLAQHNEYARQYQRALNKERIYR